MCIMLFIEDNMRNLMATIDVDICVKKNIAEFCHNCDKKNTCISTGILLRYIKATSK